jgi:hypothetical protein
MKHNQDRIDDPWEIDIAFYIEKGMAPEPKRVEEPKEENVVVISKRKPWLRSL